ncbi:MAG: chromosome partitioning protein [Sedimenticola sp.]|nr:MAG: chromosome partitioning protein [Sedimenticola sp.]
MKSIAVINQKGGVGKTTVTANLGHALAQHGKHVTLIDLDPQGQLSASLGLFRPPKQGIDEVMLNAASIESVSVSTREGLMLVPAGANLGDVEKQSAEGVQRALLLQKGMQRSGSDKDYLLIDCPPSSGLLMANAIMAVDEVLIPVTGDYLGLNGLAHLLATLKQFERLRHRPLGRRVLLSRLVARRRLSKEVVGKLKNHFPGKIMATAVREAAVLAECPGVGRTIFEYRPGSVSAKEFTALAVDLIEGRMMS